jgi:hypothetical protein
MHVTCPAHPISPGFITLYVTAHYAIFSSLCYFLSHRSKYSSLFPNTLNLWLFPWDDTPSFNR